MVQSPLKYHYKWKGEKDNDRRKIQLALVEEGTQERMFNNRTTELVAQLDYLCFWYLDRHYLAKAQNVPEIAEQDDWGKEPEKEWE